MRQQKTAEKYRYQYKSDHYQQNLHRPPHLNRHKLIDITYPHDPTLLENYYPWVVSIRKDLETGDGKKHAVVLDVRFSQIANYVDEVGIGQHGYCFIMDKKGNIVYHPQQQLIYSGLKSEQTDILTRAGDGTLVKKNVIYSIRSLDNCDWRIVGVSYIDELVTVKVRGAMQILLVRFPSV